MSDMFVKKVTEKIAKNPNIVKPLVKCTDITDLNFNRMKEMGLEKIIISKDNILTLEFLNDFINPKI